MKHFDYRKFIRGKASRSNLWSGVRDTASLQKTEACGTGNLLVLMKPFEQLGLESV